MQTKFEASQEELAKTEGEVATKVREVNTLKEKIKQAELHEAHELEKKQEAQGKERAFDLTCYSPFPFFFIFSNFWFALYVSFLPRCFQILSPFFLF